MAIERVELGTPVIKESLSFVEVGNLVSALSSEQKALTFALMEKGVVYNSYQLTKRIRQVQEGVNGVGWTPNPGTILGYCRDSLSGIGGLINIIEEPNSQALKFIKSDYGEKINGDVLAGLLLNLSDELSRKNESPTLAQIFSSANSPNGKLRQIEDADYVARGPITRMKIILTLASLPTGKKITLTDLDEQIKNQFGDEFDFRIRYDDHMQYLQRIGLIHYEARRMPGPITKYSLIDKQQEKLPKLLGTRSLVEEVFEVCRDNVSGVSIDQVYGQLMEKEPVRKSLKKKAWVASINLALSTMYKNGFLEKSDLRFGSYSSIRLDVKQKKAINLIATTINGFINSDPILMRVGQNIVEKIRSEENGTLMSNLMSRAKIASNRTKEHYRTNLAKVIIDLISNNNSSLEELRSKLKELEMSFTNRGLFEVLSHLRDEGVVLSRKRNGVNYWSRVS